MHRWQGKHRADYQLLPGSGRVYWHGRLVPNTRVSELPWLSDKFVTMQLLEEALREAGGRQRQNAAELKVSEERLQTLQAEVKPSFHFPTHLVTGTSG